MRIYLDCCCFNRPFDDQSQARVRLETVAIESILEMVEAGTLELVSSEILDVEISQVTNEDRRQRILRIHSVASNSILRTGSVDDLAKRLMGFGIQFMDALHLASAGLGGVAVFLTVDDVLLRRAERAASILSCRVMSPVSFQLLQDKGSEE